jgi:biopolymer transport protein ExbD
MVRAKKHVEKNHAVNFFVPMVDLMVSIIFVFIIIVMVLLLLISVELKSNSESESTSEGTESSVAVGSLVKPSIIERAIANQSAKEILAHDVTRELLKKEGDDSIFDAEQGRLEIRIKQPKILP